MKEVRMKSVRKKIAEGRCRGIGAEYTPFLRIQEARSSGTATMVPDPIEGRNVHLLSTTEKDLYFMLRIGAGVEHIREQMLLDMNSINILLQKRGLPRAGDNIAYTTDLLVNYQDGREIAYSVKWSKDLFNVDSVRYQGRKHKYYSLINRQDVEREYWESQGVDFCIVTHEYINHILASNNRLLMGYYDDRLGLYNSQQRLLHLMARGYITWPKISSEYIVPAKLVEQFPYDIDSYYERVSTIRPEVTEWVK